MMRDIADCRENGSRPGQGRGIAADQVDQRYCIRLGPCGDEGLVIPRVLGNSSRPPV